MNDYEWYCNCSQCNKTIPTRMAICWKGYGYCSEECHKKHKAALDARDQEEVDSD